MFLKANIYIYISFIIMLLQHRRMQYVCCKKSLESCAQDSDWVCIYVIFFFVFPCFVVPVFEEHPDISQGVSRQVRPAQQWAVWPFWPLWCQGLRQGELNITHTDGWSTFSLYKMLCIWADSAIDSENGSAHMLYSNYSGRLETWRCLCYWYYYLERECCSSVVRKSLNLVYGIFSSMKMGRFI